jgi:hypothetical protein
VQIVREKKKNYDGSLENGEITQFYFKKLIELELAVSLVVAINLYLIVVAVREVSCRQDSLSQLLLRNRGRLLIFAFISHLFALLWLLLY